MANYEDTLIQQSKEGDPDAFNQLVERYQGQVYNVSLRMLGNPQDAEDLTQETFVLAWKAIPRFKGGNFRAWILRIASNACTDVLRSRKGRRVDPMDEVFPDYNPLQSEAEAPEDHVLREEVSHFISEQLLLLSEEQRLVIILADLQGLSYEEIAQVTRCSIGTVKSRLSRARSNLRDLLLEHKELLPAEFRL